MVQNVIASAFETLSRVEEGVEILDVFQHFSAREVSYTTYRFNITPRLLFACSACVLHLSMVLRNSNHRSLNFPVRRHFFNISEIMLVFDELGWFDVLHQVIYDLWRLRKH